MKPAIIVTGKGDVFVFAEDDDRPDLGPLKGARASHVEMESDGDGWSVRLSDAEYLGTHKGEIVARHVARHADALEIERKRLVEVLSEAT